MSVKPKTSMTGKIIAIIASMIMIAFVFVDWVDLSKVEEYYDNYDKLDKYDEEEKEIMEDYDYKFSLFDISKVLKEEVVENSDDESAGVVATVGSTAALVIAYIIIFLAALNILGVLFGWTTFSKIITVFSIVFSVLLAGGFIVLTYLISSLTGIGLEVDHLFRATFSPYIVIVGSIVACVGVRLRENKMPDAGMRTESVIPVNSNTVVGNVCPNCGAARTDGSNFCASCGNKFQQ